MPLSLICDCGARFEVEDALAGQTVSCPECQQPLKAPAVRRPTVRTSNFALASFLLAIVGAFTVVGTIAAVILGLIAVVAILRDRERLAGLGFAACGIVLGLAFTTLTVYSLTTGELFGAGAAMRRRQMADQLEPVDPAASLLVQGNGFSLTRPSSLWSRAKNAKGFQYLAIQPVLRGDALLLLVQPDLNAFVDVQALTTQDGLDTIENRLLGQLQEDQSQPPPAKDKEKPKGKPQFQAPGDEEDRPTVGRIGDVHKMEGRDKLEVSDPIVEGKERTIQALIDDKGWTFLIRAYRTSDGKVYIVRAFTETARFAHVKDELKKILDSFKVTPGS